MGSTLLSEHSLSNFNWSISVVQSSSNKAEMKEPVLQLQFNTQYGYSSQNILLEFNYSELCSFLDEVNAVKDKCQGY